MSPPSDPSNRHWHFSNFSDEPFQLDGGSLPAALLSFFFIFFFTFLFIFIFYICKRHRRASAVRSMSNPTAPHMVELGLDPVTIKALPIFQHGAADSELDCAICISIYQEGELVKVLPQCRHTFHAQCIDKWLMTHSSCPLCRTTIVRGGGGDSGDGAMTAAGLFV